MSEPSNKKTKKDLLKFFNPKKILSEEKSLFEMPEPSNKKTKKDLLKFFNPKNLLGNSIEELTKSAATKPKRGFLSK